MLVAWCALNCIADHQKEKEKKEKKKKKKKNVPPFLVVIS